MTFQRGNQSTSRNSQNAENTSMFASRPAVIQTQHSQLASTAEEIEQQKFDANKLENQDKFGTENLGLFLGKGNFWNQKTSRFNHDFSSIPVHSPNTATQRIIQPQLTIGKVGDKYEQEADKVAADVVNRMHQPESEKVQRQEISEKEELQRKQEIGSIQREELPEDEEKLQMKPIVQRLADEGGMAAKPDLEASIQQARGGGQPLAENVQKPMEKAFRADFTRVKVHTDARSDQLNQSIHAKAFTTGQDVFFRQGAYDPGSRGGQELIAHELTHVMQQQGEARNYTKSSMQLVQRQKKQNVNLVEQGLQDIEDEDAGIEDAFQEMEEAFNHTTKYYHGRAVREGYQNETPVIKNFRNRGGLDFDPSEKGGFYLGTSEEGAKEWAKENAAKSRATAVEKGSIHATTKPIPVVFVYEVKDGLVAQLDGKSFPENPDLGSWDWQKFILASRTKKHTHSYDWVSGAMIQNVKTLFTLIEKNEDAMTIANQIERVPELDQIALYSEAAFNLFDTNYLETISIDYTDPEYENLKLKLAQQASSKEKQGIEKWSKMTVEDQAKARKEQKEKKAREKQKRIEKNKNPQQQ